LNLDASVNQPSPRTHTHIEHLLENISDNELHEYEKLVPSHYAQHDPNQTYTFVVFDTETTWIGKNAELCQLSAIHENQVFWKYILPTGYVSTGASRVNKLSVQNIDGIRKLLKENQPVETVSLDKALKEFHTFFSQVKCSSQKESCIVLYTAKCTDPIKQIYSWRRLKQNNSLLRSRYLGRHATLLPQ